MNIKYIKCKSALSNSKLPGLDYSLNPYIGCKHNCIYCYAPYILRINRKDWSNNIGIKTNIPTILSRELKNKPVGATRFGQRWAFWRDSQGQAACVEDRCAHRGAALSLGVIQKDAIACPFHGFCFDRTGQCVKVPVEADPDIPPRLKVKSRAIREAGGWRCPPEEKLMLKTSDYLLLLGAFLSFLLSVGLWFFGQKEAGIFVGLWVPSILSFGAYVRSTVGQR